MLANSVDPDQTLCSAVSDLGLHYLPRSHKRQARLIWVRDSYHCILMLNEQRYNMLRNFKNARFYVDCFTGLT